MHVERYVRFRSSVAGDRPEVRFKLDIYLCALQLTEHVCDVSLSNVRWGPSIICQNSEWLSSLAR